MKKRVRFSETLKRPALLSLFSVAVLLLSACGSGENKLGEYAANSECHTLQGKPIRVSYRYAGETYVFDLQNKLGQIASKFGTCANGSLSDQDVTDIVATLSDPQASYCGTTQNTGTGLNVKSDTADELAASEPSDKTLKMNQKWDDFVGTMEGAAKYAIENCNSNTNSTF